MPTLGDVLVFGANHLLAPFGYEARLRILNEKPEGFPGFVEQARKAGMDVNEWEDAFLNWKPAAPIIQHLISPLLSETSNILEIGPGSGRFSRQILPGIPRGNLHLVDHSAWMVRFLRAYFTSADNVQVHLTDGCSVPIVETFDLAFSGGTFIAFKLGVIFLYLKEFARVVRPGGHVVFDYLDPTRPEAWAHLESQGADFANVYAFHAPETIDRLLAFHGFAVLDRWQVGKSTYITAQKAII